MTYLYCIRFQRWLNTIICPTAGSGQYLGAIKAQAALRKILDAKHDARQVSALLGCYRVELYLYAYRSPHNFNVPFNDMDAKIRPSGENETPVTAIV